MHNDIQTLLDMLEIPRIDNLRNYWLIRTEGGDYYDDYIIGGFVALGFNKITKTYLDKAYSKETPNPKKFLKERISMLYPDNSRPGLSASYINTFFKGIQKGDIVAIPNENSQIISFGEVVDETLYYESEDEINASRSLLMGARTVCPYVMRRKVMWLKQVQRDDLDLKFFKSLFAHNTISSLEEYGNVIDRMLCNIFVKDNCLHYKLNITTNEDISFVTYMQLTNSIYMLCEDFNTFGDADIKCNVDDLSVKTQADSPGFWELISSLQLPDVDFGFIPVILVLAVLQVGILGGKVGFATFNLETDGLIKKIMEWRKHLREDKSEALKQYESVMKVLQVPQLNAENEQDDTEQHDQKDNNDD